MANVIKLTVTANGEPADIRYVDMLYDNFTFHDIKSKIIYANQIPPDADIKITWIDREGDHVSILSDSEMKIAFAHMPELKALHVSYNTKPKAATFDERATHMGSHIICDVCEKAVTGYRYKCLECEDYDLCATCEGAGNHSEHIFLRLPNSQIPLSRMDRKVLYTAARDLKKAAHHSRRGHFLGTFSCPGKDRGHKGKGHKRGHHYQEDSIPTCPFVMDDFTRFGSMAKDHLSSVLQNPNESLIADVIRNAIDIVFRGPETDPQASQNETNQNQSQNQENNAQHNSSETVNIPSSSASTVSSSDDNTTQPEKQKESQGVNIPETERITTEQADMDWTVVNASLVEPMQPITATPTTPQNTPTTSVTPTSIPVQPPFNIISASVPRAPAPVTMPSAPVNTTTNPTSTTTAPTDTTAAPNIGFRTVHFVPPEYMHPDPIIANGLIRLYEMGFPNENGLLNTLLVKYRGSVPDVVQALLNMK